jgi:hypothetical protein
MNAIRIRFAFLAPSLADFALSGLQLYKLTVAIEESFVPRALLCAIALSWGVLLLVAYRKPKERFWVLRPTMLVISLIALAMGAALIRGLITPTYFLAVFVICGLLVGLCWSGLSCLQTANEDHFDS